MGIARWIGSWPVYRQLAGPDKLGRGRAAESPRSAALTPRTQSADRVADSVCPYCAVGCAQRIYVRDEKVIQIEGNPDSPVSRGRLCPKGSASKQLVTGPHRQQKVLYRAPYGTAWQPLDLDAAMDMIADRVLDARRRGPRVRASEPAFATLLQAVQTGRVVTFDYRRPVPAEVRTRTVEPWGVVSWRGRWYLVGHDRDRRAPRCFRLSRIVGDAKATGKPGVVETPAGVDLMSYVKGFDDDPAHSTLARLWVAKGQAQGLRRRARLVGTDVVDGIEGDLLEIELNLPESAAGWIAGFGADVEVLEPEVLRKSVYERLLGALAAADGKAL